MQRSKPQTAHLMASPDDVEAQFFEALRERDIDKLMALWSDDDDVVCVHPGGTRATGVQAVRAAFEALLSAGRIAVQPENVRRVHTLDAAVHSLVEHVEIVTAEGSGLATVIVTNVYHKTAQGWRMVAHHASLGAVGPEADAAESAGSPAILH